MGYINKLLSVGNKLNAVDNLYPRFSVYVVDDIILGSVFVLWTIIS